MEASEKELLIQVNEKLAQVNQKLDRVLAIFDGPGELDEKVFFYCLQQFAAGNGKPLDEYHKRGGKMPHVENPARKGRHSVSGHGGFPVQPNETGGVV